MGKTIAAKIDVTLIEKDRLFKGKKPNKKELLPMYLDVILIETVGDKYGNDFMVVQAVTKEERQKGVRGPILGNAKFLAGKDGGRQPAPAAETESGAPGPADDVPF